MSPSPVWIDAHCHLTDLRLFSKVSAKLEEAKNLGIGGWVLGGVEPNDWKRQIQLHAEFPEVIPVLGLHPWWVAKQTKEEAKRALKTLEQSLPQARGLGETGLDYLDRFRGTEEIQTSVFKEQLEMAKRFKKPLVLHIVKAHAEALGILRERGPFPQGGLVHSFSASAEIAMEYLNLGLTLSISGAITKQGFSALKKAIPTLPKDRLVVETDAPDQPIGGAEINEPRNLLDIAEAIGRLRKESAKDVLDQSRKNLEKIFGKIL